MILEHLDVTVADFEALSGWTLKPEGACKGDLCVPLDGNPQESFDLAAVAARLGMAIVGDDDSGAYALGPATVTGRALSTAEASELVLPDVDGNEFRLSSLRGQKVVLVAWAPY
jgi:hypothetical protein